jgi:hypothetical protein
MTTIQLETQVLRPVVRPQGEVVEQFCGTTGEMADRTGGSPNTNPYPPLNPCSAAPSARASTSAMLADATPDADTRWPGAGRPQHDGSSFGSVLERASQPAAGGRADFRQVPEKSVRLALRVKGNPRGSTRTDFRRTGNASVGG